MVHHLVLRGGVLRALLLHTVVVVRMHRGRLIRLCALLMLQKDGRVLLTLDHGGMLHVLLL